MQEGESATPMKRRRRKGAFTKQLKKVRMGKRLARIGECDTREITRALLFEVECEEMPLLQPQIFEVEHT